MCYKEDVSRTYIIMIPLSHCPTFIPVDPDLQFPEQIGQMHAQSLLPELTTFSQDLATFYVRCLCGLSLHLSGGTISPGRHSDQIQSPHDHTRSKHAHDRRLYDYERSKYDPRRSEYVNVLTYPQAMSTIYQLIHFVSPNSLFPTTVVRT